MNRIAAEKKSVAEFVTGLLVIVLILSACTSNNEKSYQTEKWSFSIDSKGKITRWKDKLNNQELLLPDHETYLVSLKADSSIIHPSAAVFSEDDQNITLTFENDIQLEVKVLTKKQHISFEAISLSNENNIDALIWGPYYTLLNKSIGELVGIAQGENFTVGIQALNTKTLGGSPWKDDDFLPQMDIFSQSDVNNMTKEEGTPYTLYSVETAKPVHNGSSLQAYTQNRNHDRIIENWGHQKYVAPAYNDGGLIGSKIALFACPTEETLNTIGEIEITEGLPLPTLNGQWVKNRRLLIHPT